MKNLTYNKRKNPNRVRPDSIGYKNLGLLDMYIAKNSVNVQRINKLCDMFKNR